MPTNAAKVGRPREASPSPGIAGDLGGLQSHPLAEEELPVSPAIGELPGGANAGHVLRKKPPWLLPRGFETRPRAQRPPGALGPFRG